MSNFKRYINTIPRVFNPEFNRVLYALLTAIATADDDVETSIEEGKKQLFVRTATGRYLDRIANSLGVARPATLGLSDEDFQNLIPNLSLKPKSIRKAFYDTADIFWGPLFSRANITSNNSAPFNVSTGDIISVRIDARSIQNVKVLTRDIAVNGAATANEIQVILSRIKGATIEIVDDGMTGDLFINLRTNTPGSTGQVEILDSTMVSPTKLDFTLGAYDILDLDQRVSIYNMNPNEIIIEIPAIVPALRRTLKGSHHFHADATIEPPVPPTNGIWAGSFLYNPTGSINKFTITGQKSELQETITEGQVYTSIEVDDTSLIENQTGKVIFDFGRATQEGPVKYRGVPNSNTILLDPAYIFQFDHSVGSDINVISKEEPYKPLRNGKDLAIYLTSPATARQIVQDILESLAAAGIIVRFIILGPTYKYLLDNPYITSDDAPSEDV